MVWDDGWVVPGLGGEWNRRPTGLRVLLRDFQELIFGGMAGWEGAVVWVSGESNETSPSPPRQQAEREWVGVQGSGDF